MSVGSRQVNDRNQGPQLQHKQESKDHDKDQKRQQAQGMAHNRDKVVLIDISLTRKQDCQMKEPSQGRSPNTNDKL